MYKKKSHSVLTRTNPDNTTTTIILSEFADEYLEQKAITKNKLTHDDVDFGEKFHAHQFVSPKLEAYGHSDFEISRWNLVGHHPMNFYWDLSYFKYKPYFGIFLQQMHPIEDKTLAKNPICFKYFNEVIHNILLKLEDFVKNNMWFCLKYPVIIRAYSEFLYFVANRFSTKAKDVYPKKEKYLKEIDQTYKEIVAVADAILFPCQRLLSRNFKMPTESTISETTGNAFAEKFLKFEFVSPYDHNVFRLTRKQIIDIYRRQKERHIDMFRKCEYTNPFAMSIFDFDSANESDCPKYFWCWKFYCEVMHNILMKLLAFIRKEPEFCAPYYFLINSFVEQLFYCAWILQDFRYLYVPNNDTVTDSTHLEQMKTTYNDIKTLYYEDLRNEISDLHTRYFQTPQTPQIA